MYDFLVLVFNLKKKKIDSTANMTKFEQVLALDAKNEASPLAKRKVPKERALKKQTSLIW